MARQQIYNNYGMKTNAELLLGYGFVSPETEAFHNDYVPRQDESKPRRRRSERLAHRGSAGILPSQLGDSLVAALYESVATRNDVTSDVSLTEIMQGNIPPELLEEIIDSLGTKLSIDLEEIEQHDPPYEATNRNQELALLYRSQCKKVLDYALASLS
ncbi:hypothetical protein NUW58_g10003 [Xylaria curta]|uniref:Uncharacterized protein n=1 Tax=Xylaria curta TaxID=42375 RepID=A0ACC1MRU3_9PEZI|nr:hypothetical protein NUW58_g10003 [Xylaria curta]